MARKKLIAANWKMNKTIGEAKAFIETLKSGLADLPDCEAERWRARADLQDLQRADVGPGRLDDERAVRERGRRDHGLTFDQRQYVFDALDLAQPVGHGVEIGESAVDAVDYDVAV